MYQRTTVHYFRESEIKVISDLTIDILYTIVTLSLFSVLRLLQLVLYLKPTWISVHTHTPKHTSTQTSQADRHPYTHRVTQRQTHKYRHPTLTHTHTKTEVPIISGVGMCHTRMVVEKWIVNNILVIQPSPQRHK